MKGEAEEERQRRKGRQKEGESDLTKQKEKKTHIGELCTHVQPRFRSEEATRARSGRRGMDRMKYRGPSIYNGVLSL